MEGELSCGSRGCRRSWHYQPRKPSTWSSLKPARKSYWWRSLSLSWEFGKKNSDNQSVIHLAKNVAYHSRTKHIQWIYHWLRERVEDKEFSLVKVHTNDNGSDMLTKVLGAEKLNVCRQRLRLMKYPMPEWRGSLLGNRSLQMGREVTNLVEWVVNSTEVETETENQFHDRFSTEAIIQNSQNVV